MAIITARKHGNSIYLVIPALMCKRGSIKHGDVFKLEKDGLLPNLYSLQKLSDNGNSL